MRKRRKTLYILLIIRRNIRTIKNRIDHDDEERRTFYKSKSHAFIHSEISNIGDFKSWNSQYWWFKIFKFKNFGFSMNHQISKFKIFAVSNIRISRFRKISHSPLTGLSHVPRQTISQNVIKLRKYPQHELSYGDDRLCTCSKIYSDNAHHIPAIRQLFSGTRNQRQHKTHTKKNFILDSTVP